MSDTDATPAVAVPIVGAPGADAANAAGTPAATTPPTAIMTASNALEDRRTAPDAGRPSVLRRTCVAPIYASTLEVHQNGQVALNATTPARSGKPYAADAPAERVTLPSPGTVRNARNSRAAS